MYRSGSEFNGWGKRVFAYCHAMSMSKVGTKNEVGVEAIRSRNLIWSVGVSDVSVVFPLLHIRMISGHTMVQRNFIFFVVEKSRLAPSELVHLFCKSVLSKNLLRKIVNPTGELLGTRRAEPTAPTRSTENGRSSLYALRILLKLTGGSAGASL